MIGRIYEFFNDDDLINVNCTNNSANHIHVRDVMKSMYNKSISFSMVFKLHSRVYLRKIVKFYFIMFYAQKTSNLHSLCTMLDFDLTAMYIF